MRPDAAEDLFVLFVLTVHGFNHSREKLLPRYLDLRIQRRLEFAGDGDGDAVSQQL